MNGELCTRELLAVRIPISTSGKDEDLGSLALLQQRLGRLVGLVALVGEEASSVGLW